MVWVSEGEMNEPDDEGINWVASASANQLTNEPVGTATEIVEVLAPKIVEGETLGVASVGAANMVTTTAVLGLSQETPFWVTVADTYRVVVTLRLFTEANAAFGVPPVGTSYQLSTPADAWAVSVTELL